MERIQPYYKLNRKRKEIEVWDGQPNRNMRVYPKTYSLDDEEIGIVERLLQRDFKSAILFRRHSNEVISEMALDILERRG